MKRKKTVWALASIMVMALALTSCGKKQETMVEETTAASTQAQETESETETESEEAGLQIIEERKVVDGKMQSYLTGEWKKEEVVVRRPLAVIIPTMPRQCRSMPFLRQVSSMKLLWKDELPVLWLFLRILMIWIISVL